MPATNGSYGAGPIRKPCVQVALICNMYEPALAARSEQRKRFGDEQPIDNHNNDTELFFKISVALDVQYRYRRSVKTKLTVFVCSGLAPKGALCGYINKKSRKYYKQGPC